MAVLNPESLAVYSERIGTDRANPYFKPGAFSALASGGLQVFSNSNCASTAPSISGPANETISEELIQKLIVGGVANQPETPNKIPAPACNQQSPFTFNGFTGQFPHAVYGGK
jgi:hypothetical protein